MKRENEDKCLEDEAKHRKTDAEIKIEFEKLTIGEAIGRLQGMERSKQNEILRKSQAINGILRRRVPRLSADIFLNV